MRRFGLSAGLALAFVLAVFFLVPETQIAEETPPPEAQRA